MEVVPTGLKNVMRGRTIETETGFLRQAKVRSYNESCQKCFQVSSHIYFNIYKHLSQRTKPIELPKQHRCESGACFTEFAILSSIVTIIAENCPQNMMG